MPLTYLGLRESLVARFGERAARLAREEEAWVESVGGNADGISPYRYMSKVFFDGFLAPALDRHDLAGIRKCADLVEEMLESGDPDLCECVVIRVSTMVLFHEHWKRLAAEHGGPLWRRSIAALTDDPN